MKRIVRINILIVCISCFFLQQVKANDVQVKIPETSVNAVLGKLVNAKFFSYGSTHSESTISYYSLKVKSAIVDIKNGNQFDINIIADARANFSFSIFNFDKQLDNRSITIHGHVEIQNQGSGYKVVFVPDNLTYNQGGVARFNYQFRFR
ncbi:MAG: hypothetical protein RLN90_01200 [Balneolaceae bacterium]